MSQASIPAVPRRVIPPAYALPRPSSHIMTDALDLNVMANRVRAVFKGIEKCHFDVRCFVHWILHSNDKEFPFECRVREGVLRIRKTRRMHAPSAPTLTALHKLEGELVQGVPLYEKDRERLIQDPFASLSPECNANPVLSSVLTKTRKDVLIGMAEKTFLASDFPPPADFHGRMHIQCIEFTVTIPMDGFDLTEQIAYMVQTDAKELSHAQTLKCQMLLLFVPVRVLRYQHGKFHLLPFTKKNDRIQRQIIAFFAKFSSGL
jgi:hypothetical protein